MSKVLTFSILNSCADQLNDLHGLSDAGAGAGLMGLTPARDSEIIASARTVTRLPAHNGQGFLPEQPLLGNGGVTPAILTHGLLQLFRRKGYVVRLRCYNLGLAVTPELPADRCLLDGAESFSCSAEQLKPFVANTLLPNLEQEARDGELSLLAECGVGGTLFANLWLRSLLDPQILLAGSTRDPEKLHRKALLLDQLQSQVRTAFGPMPSPEQWLSDSRYHDAMQCALVQILRHWAQHPKLPALKLAGGMMMAAPALALMAQEELSRERYELMTTRWIKPQGQAGSDLMDKLTARLDMHLHQSRFASSRHDCVRRYDQGLVVEGCGLGACLVLAEQMGIAEADILSALDQTIDSYLG